jgi:hypothetical protein
LIATSVASLGLTRLPAWTITAPVRPSIGERIEQ